MQEKQLTFSFHYDDPSHTLPTGIGILPNPSALDDYIILFIIATFMQVLRDRHGLEQALIMTEQAGYGKIGQTEFAMKWTPKDEMEDVYGDLDLPED